MDQKRSIAEKYSLDYYRRSLPTRSWKAPWNYAALVLALFVLGGMYLIARNSAFQAAPVASVHSSFGADCGSCHEKSWGAGRRLISLSGTNPSVADATCRACHPVGNHAGVPLQEPACAACHQEHRPERRLVDVADSACTGCHQDLASVVESEFSFASGIRQFSAGTGGHPEFAIFRPSKDAMGPRHEAQSHIAFAGAGEQTGKWVDLGGLKFNHRLHLDRTGVLGPERKPVRLSCAECHLSGSDGHMKPIVYEQHCNKCHPLHMAASFRETTELPHSSVEEVRGVIRERLARQIERTTQDSAELQLGQRLPRLPAPSQLSNDQEKQLSKIMNQADHAVFGLEAKGMCRHCHHVEQRDGDWHVLLTNGEIADATAATSEGRPPEMVPSRWMPHANFNHRSHGAMECAICHRAESSSKTADILMPPVANCRTCHGEGARSAVARVNADCVLCHSYHDAAQAARFQGVSLDQLFPTSDQSD